MMPNRVAEGKRDKWTRKGVIMGAPRNLNYDPFRSRANGACVDCHHTHGVQTTICIHTHIYKKREDHKAPPCDCSIVHKIDKETEHHKCGCTVKQQY